MPETAFTVNTLLGLPDKEFADRVAAAGADSARAGQDDKKSFKERVLQGLRGLQWKSVEGQIKRKSSQLLEVDVMGLIASAWHQGKVSDGLEEKHKGKGINVTIPLKDHRIFSELHPALEIQFGDFTHRIVLDVELEMTLMGIILNIEDSRIRAIEAGSIEGFGRVTISRVPILKRTFGPFDLPGRVNLRDGIPLARSTPEPGRASLHQSE